MPIPLVVWAAAGVLARLAAKKAAQALTKQAAKYAAKKSAQRLVQRMMREAVKKGKKKFERELAETRKKCPKCKPKDTMCKRLFGGNGTITPGRYRGGAYDSLGAQRHAIERHHIPSNDSNGMSTGRGPSIQMDYKDHLQTSSWGRAKGAVNYRTEQGALVTNKKFMTAMAMDIFELKARFGGKYDQAIKEAIAYTACLDAVRAARKNKR